jgi:hypothetical protein
MPQSVDTQILQELRAIKSKLATVQTNLEKKFNERIDKVEENINEKFYYRMYIISFSAKRNLKMLFKYFF